MNQQQPPQQLKDDRKHNPEFLLEQRPKKQENSTPKPNPFLNPSPDLLVAEFSAKTITTARLHISTRNTTIKPKNHNHDNNDGGNNESNNVNDGLKPTHILLLNKFPIIANHFILATKDFKRQTDLLEKDDLVAAFACLKAWSRSGYTNTSDGPITSSTSSGIGSRNWLRQQEQSNDEIGDESFSEEKGKRKDQNQKRLFAFFNSGHASGASQPHRHVQFLPVESITTSTATTTIAGEGDLENDAWTPLIDRFSEASSLFLLEGRRENDHNDPPSQRKKWTTNPIATADLSLKQISELPFVHFARILPPHPSAELLYDTYLALYQAAVDAIHSHYHYHHQDQPKHIGVELTRQSSSQTAPSPTLTNNQKDINTEKEEASPSPSLPPSSSPPPATGTRALLAGDGSIPSAISYNLAMTESVMMICPRRNESAGISSVPDDNRMKDKDDYRQNDMVRNHYFTNSNAATAATTNTGLVALNGTILAGTLMVKFEEEWNQLRENPWLLNEVLRIVGVPT